MKIQLIRNATMKITYAGQTFLTDPMLSDKGVLDPFAGIAKNPTIKLPLSIDEIKADIEGIIVSHDHPDHLDDAATSTLGKDIPVFCQPGDETRIRKEGFNSVLPIDKSHTWEGISITRTGGKHGKGEILEQMGNVSGFIFQGEGEPTVYWIGDSIWCEEVEETITKFNPDFIITHSGGATIPGFDPIIMDVAQTLKTANSSEKAVIIAIHMESLDHCTVDRNMLRQKADEAAIPHSRLIIPEDGEILSFE